MGEDRTGPYTRRLTVAQTADQLGISEGAVRNRIKRGTLRAEREAGRVYVLLVGPAQSDNPTGESGLVAVLREQLVAERQAHAESRRLLAAALERIPPQLEPPRDAREHPEKVDATRNTQPEAPQAARTPGDAGNTLIYERGRYYEPSYATLPTAGPLAIVSGLAAGFANPLLMAQTDNVVWSAVFLLWVVPPIFGLWLGRTVTILRADYWAVLVAANLTNAGQMSVEDFNAKFGHLSRGGPQDQGQWANHNLGLMRNKIRNYTVIVGLLTVLSSLGVFWFGIGVVEQTVALREALGVAIVQGIIASMFVLFAALIGLGRERQRREAEHPRAAGEGSAEAARANRQALIGLVGTIITAICGLLAVLVQVFSSSGGSGG